jgi:hypothetical protein
MPRRRIPRPSRPGGAAPPAVPAPRVARSPCRGGPVRAGETGHGHAPVAGYRRRSPRRVALHAVGAVALWSGAAVLAGTLATPADKRFGTPAPELDAPSAAAPTSTFASAAAAPAGDATPMPTAPTGEGAGYDLRPGVVVGALVATIGVLAVARRVGRRPRRAVGPAPVATAPPRATWQPERHGACRRHSAG